MGYSDRMTAAYKPGKVFDFTRGDRFRRARQSAGFERAQEFAELIGVSRNTISSAENDRSLPRPIVIRAWALATPMGAPRPAEPVGQLVLELGA